MGVEVNRSHLSNPPRPQIEGGGQMEDTVPPDLLTSEYEVPADEGHTYFTEWQQAPAGDDAVGERLPREVHASGARTFPLAAAISGEHSGAR